MPEGGEVKKEWNGWRWTEKSNANHTSVPNAVNPGKSRSMYIITTPTATSHELENRVAEVIICH